MRVLPFYMYSVRFSRIQYVNQINITQNQSSPRLPNIYTIDHDFHMPHISCCGLCVGHFGHNFLHASLTPLRPFHFGHNIMTKHRSHAIGPVSLYIVLYSYIFLSKGIPQTQARVMPLTRVIIVPVVRLEKYVRLSRILSICLCRLCLLVLCGEIVPSPCSPDSIRFLDVRSVMLND